MKYSFYEVSWFETPPTGSNQHARNIHDGGCIYTFSNFDAALAFRRFLNTHYKDYYRGAHITGKALIT